MTDDDTPPSDGSASHNSPPDDSLPDGSGSPGESAAIQSTEELYEVTYHATRSAIWDVLGDVALTLVLAIIGLIGLQLTLASAFAMSSFVPLLVGLVVILVAGGGILYLHGLWPFD